MILEPIALYCERTAPGVLGEPVNLAASASLLLVAVLAARMTAGRPFLRFLGPGVLCLFCLVSALHMWPSRLTIGLVIAMILALLLFYFYLANRLLVGLSPRLSLVAMLLVLPFGAISLPLVALTTGSISSMAFVPIPVLLLGYAIILRSDKPGAARGFFLGALIALLALGARTLDQPLCERLPHGTHFLWVLGIALLLWHLTRVLSAHALAGQAGDR